jgi:hypothetical protein
MRLILKLIAAPVALTLTIATAFFSFVLSLSGVFLGALSGLVSIGAVILLVTGETAGGLAWLAVAFLAGPCGLPGLAHWIVGRLERLGGALKGFIFG